MQASVTWAPALAADGSPAPDARVSANSMRGDTALQFKVWFPATLWGRAGLHTGDRLESWNGAMIRDAPRFRDAVGTLRIGDTARVIVRRGAETLDKTIAVTGYERPTVKLGLKPDATAAQRLLFTRWMAGR